jgi:hypothetical protein
MLMIRSKQMLLEIMIYYMVSCAARQEMKSFVHCDANVYDRGDRNCNNIRLGTTVSSSLIEECAMMILSAVVEGMI